MEELLRENARLAREAMGPAVLRVPSVDDDASLRLRYHTLWRSLYPSTAPAPHSTAAGNDVTNSSSCVAQEAVPDKPQKAHVGALSVVMPSMTTTGNNNAALSVVPSAAHKPSSSSATVASSLSLLTQKRGRQDSEADKVLDVDPATLRARHALTVATNAAAAAASSGEVDDETGKQQQQAAAYRAPASWKMSKVLVGHQGWVWTAAVDPSNAWFATGAFDAVIKVWDLASGALKLNLTGHKEAVRALALSRRSPYMFSGSDDRSVKCWDLERNEIIRDFFGHKSAVHCLAVHPALDVVLSGGRDKTVRVWDIRSRAVVHTLVGHTDSVMSLLAQQADPQVISGGSDGLIQLWDLAAGRSMLRLTRHKKPVRGLALHPSGSPLVSCGADEIRVWGMPSGSYIATASTRPLNAAGTSSLKQRADEELAYRWSSCAMSPRNVLAVGSQDGQLAFYDWNRPQPAALELRHYAPYQFTKTRSMPGTLPGEGGINCVCYDMSGTRLITAESDKSVKIWRQRQSDE